MFDCIGVFKIPCMWPGRELWVAGGRRGGNEWDRTTPEDTEEQFQCRCRRIRPAATAAPILPRCILGNTKSVGFRVMQAIMRPPPSPSLSLALQSTITEPFQPHLHSFVVRSLARSLGLILLPAAYQTEQMTSEHTPPHAVDPSSLCLLFNRFSLF